MSSYHWYEISNIQLAFRLGYAISIIIYRLQKKSKLDLALWLGKSNHININGWRYYSPSIPTVIIFNHNIMSKVISWAFFLTTFTICRVYTYILWLWRNHILFYVIHFDLNWFRQRNRNCLVRKLRIQTAVQSNFV